MKTTVLILAAFGFVCTVCLCIFIFIFFINNMPFAPFSGHYFRRIGVNSSYSMCMREAYHHAIHIPASVFYLNIQHAFSTEPIEFVCSENCVVGSSAYLSLGYLIFTHHLVSADVASLAPPTTLHYITEQV